MMEWLETDGRGGFAMGSVSGIPGRRYHSILTAAVGSPANRINLVNAAQVEVQTENLSTIITPFMFTPGVVKDDGLPLLRAFSYKPWPSWIFEIEPGFEITKEIFITPDPPLTLMRWTSNLRKGTLKVRLLLSGRDYHALHRKNDSFNMKCDQIGLVLGFKPYPTLPGIKVMSNGGYAAQPTWFEGIWYQEDKERGSDHTEDLAAPGIISFDLKNPAVLTLSAENYGSASIFTEVPKDPARVFETLCAHEKVRREKLIAPLEFAADQYIVRRANGKSIIAGYPWFADWGRDTFISMRGLCIATGRLSDAENILTQWSQTISQGMLPNRFLEEGETPEYNSVDASLWYIIACDEFLKSAKSSKFKMASSTEDSLLKAIDEIISNFIKGTRYNIKCDPTDALLAAGQEGIQITWMDAKIGAYVVTPRIGKPVEIEALWINALYVAHTLLGKHKNLFEQAQAAFAPLFWNDSKKCLYDVCDSNHTRGAHDGSIRPNQIFAVGGLPIQLISGDMARSIVNVIENSLLTPPGLRTLAPSEQGYKPYYKGGHYDRDTAYHQGTVWPWLMGGFVEAWVRVRGHSREAHEEARNRFLNPLLKSLDEAGLGHLSEIHDGNFPHLHRGCPFQAWSVGEALRLDRLVLVNPK